MVERRGTPRSGRPVVRKLSRGRSRVAARRHQLGPRYSLAGACLTEPGEVDEVEHDRAGGRVLDGGEHGLVLGGDHEISPCWATASRRR